VERTPRTLATLGLALSLALGLAAAPSAEARGTIRERGLDAAILARMNAARAAHGLGPLHRNAELAVAARHHSLEMARGGYFAHASADGGSFAGRLREWYRVIGRRWGVGENLLWSTPTIDGLRAVELWLASPGHRENILSRGWKDVGCAAVHVADAPGVYGYQPVTVVTCDFGRRG
jgi:uncharacterized protein YkwD